MKTIKIQTQKPPQWILDEVKEKFGVEWESPVVFTYGDLITTSKGEMREDLLHHEPVHTKQQKEYGGADKWWREYLDNPKFRFDQELEAYRSQYKWILQTQKPSQWYKYLEAYAHDLSSPMYGNLVAKDEAIKLITK